MYSALTKNKPLTILWVGMVVYIVLFSQTKVFHDTFHEVRHATGVYCH